MRSPGSNLRSRRDCIAASTTFWPRPSRSREGEAAPLVVVLRLNRRYLFALSLGILSLTTWSLVHGAFLVKRSENLSAGGST
jgi:hypothetical protein